MPSLTINKIQETSNHFGIDSTKYSVLYESGTAGGKSVRQCVDSFRKIYTVEISDYFWRHTKWMKGSKKYKHVKFHKGASEDLIGDILKSIDEESKVVFWLDGHFSRSMPGSKGIIDCPLLLECEAIDSLYKSDEALIIIDDYRLFSTKVNEDWTDITVENVLGCFKNFKVDHYVHPDDCFCLYIMRK